MPVIEVGELFACSISPNGNNRQAGGPRLAGGRWGHKSGNLASCCLSVIRDWHGGPPMVQAPVCLFAVCLSVLPVHQ